MFFVGQPSHIESVTLLVRNDDYRPRRDFDDRKDGDFKPRRRYDDDRRSKRFSDDKPNRRYGK